MGGRWRERGSGDKKGMKEAKTMQDECTEVRIRQNSIREIKQKEENMWKTTH
jgi:hypothetical protein